VGAYNENPAASPIDAGRAYVFAPVDVPVELVSFRGEAAAGSVRLTWVTLTETDTLGFNVERALAEHGAFMRLNDHLIPGAGTTSEPHTYQYLDEAVEPRFTYWYRLEDVSLTGDRIYHGPVEVVVPCRPGSGLEILGSSHAALLLTFARPGHATLKLYDVSGRLVATLWEGNGPAGESTVIRPDLCRTLPPGLYAATLTQDGTSVRRRVAIVN
jgi:hypothetical protein